MTYDITCKWNLKNEANDLSYKTEIDSKTENKLVDSKVGDKLGV